MKTIFSSSFTNPAFSLTFIGVDRFRLLWKGLGLKVLSLLLVVMVGGMSWGQVYFHDFGTSSITTKPYTGVPTTLATNLSNSSWTTSAASWSALSGNNGMSLSLTNSSGTPTYTLTFNVASGYQLSVSSFNFWRQRSSAGATNWNMMINGITVGSGTVPTTGAALGTTNVSSVISGVTGTVNVTLTMSGASSTGTFRLDDFTLNGTVSAVSSTPTISTSGTLAAVNTTYGTESATPTSFAVSGSNLNGTEALTVTPPAGFEVATSSNFSTTIGTSASSLSLGTATSISSTIIYVRLSSTASFSGSPYSGNIVVAGGGATSQNVATVTSTVSKKALTISGLTASNKVYDGGTSVTINGSPAYSGLVNGESFSVVGTTTWAFTNKNAGNGKAITQTGTFSDPSTNYTVTQPTLTADITKVSLTVSNASVTTKTYNGNTTATLTGSLVGVISPDVVTLNGTGTYASVNVGTGISVTSTSTLTGNDAGNYTLTQPTGLSGNITIASQTITFGALSNATTSTADFSPGASASSGLSVTYISSNTSVATIVSGNIHIVGTGTTIITASQAGTSNYYAATDVPQTLTVTLAPVVIYLDVFEGSIATPYAVAPNTFATGLSSSSWSCKNGAGLFISANGNGNIGGALATTTIANTPYTLTFNVDNGYLMNVNSFNLWRFSSQSGNTISSVAINGTTISSGSISIPTGSNASSGSSLGQTNVANTVNNINGAVTINLNLTNGGNFGSFRLDNFTLYGNITCATPAAPTVNNFIVTYDGNAKSVTASTTAIAGTTPTVDWYAAASGGSALLSGSLTSPNNTNAGTYIYYAEARNSVCGSVSATRTQVTITINKATPTLSISNSALTYTGSAQSATVTGTGGGVVSNVLYNGSATVPINAGTYAVTADIAPSSNYNSVTGSSAGNFVINKASSTISITGSTSFTYSGSAQGPSTSSVSGSTGSVTYSYVNSGGTTYGPSSTPPTNAGSFTVTASVAADANYLAANSSATAFNIAKASSTISMTGSTSFVYSGSAQGPSSSNVSGSAGSVTYSYVNSGGTTYGPNSTPPTNAGSYTVTATVAADANFESASSSAIAFTITKADQSITFASTNSILSTAADYNPGATSATSGINTITYASSNPTVATIVSGNIHVTGVGQTTITASQASSDNYNATSATQTLTVNLATSISTQPSGYTILATGATPTALSVTAIGTNLSYQWYSNTTNSTSNGVAINLATSANYTPPSTSGAMYYYVVVHGDYGSDVTSNVVAVVISDIFTWNGSVSTDWNTAANWTPAGVPIATANVSVPNLTNNPVIDNLSIASNGSVTLASGTALTLSGTITNNGTFTIESGATLVQGLNSQISGNGTFSVLQNVTGTSTGNFRSYYLGSPLNSTSSSVFSPITTNNLLYNWNANTTNPNWYQITNNSTSINPGVGYLARFAQPTTLNFSGLGSNGVFFNNAPSNNPIQVPCYRQASTSYQGFNLVSNPFPSYLDWNDVYTANSTFSSTIWYRIANGSNAMVFDTYNATAGAGTNTSGLGDASRYVAPMQSFWVRIPSGGPSTANLSFSNSMREHYMSGEVAGLRSSSQDFPAFLRLNLVQGNTLDQIILYMKPDASSAFDSYDSEKMFLSGTPQLYSKVLGKSLVINGMRNNKKKTSVPLSLDLPTTGLYFFQAEEYNIEDGLIILEDKQENVFQDLTLNNAYSFYHSSGTVNDRFVIHFHLPDASITAQGPSNIELVDNDIHVEEAPIEIASNGNGKVIVSLGNQEKPEGRVQVLDASGRIIFESMLSDAETMFDLQTSAGIYYVKVSTATSEELKKIVVQP